MLNTSDVDLSDKAIRHAPTYAFGIFRLDTGRRLVLRAGEVIPLSEKLYRILLLLVEGSGKTITKEQFLSAVWPDGKPLENNLTQHVYILRSVMGSDLLGGSPILTVAGRGYRLGLPVTELSGPRAHGSEKAETREIQHETNSVALSHYCRASVELERQTPESIGQAVEYFGRALRSDASFGDAHLGLARAHWLRAEYLLTHPRRAFAKMDTETELAVDCGVGASASYALRAGLAFYRDWNRAEAAILVDKAIAIDPSSVLARATSALIRSASGIHGRAISDAHYALELAPASLGLALFLARIMMQAGDYGAATNLLTSILDVDPGYVMAAWLRAQAYLLVGEAEAALQDITSIPPTPLQEVSFRLPMMGRAYGDLGETDLARSILAKLESLASTEHVSHWSRAIVSASIGDNTAALKHLASSVNERETAALLLSSSGWFSSLATNEQFGALQKSVRDLGSCSH